MKKNLIILFLFTCSLSFGQFGAWGNNYGGFGGVCEDCYTSLSIGVISSNINGIDNASSKTGFHFGYYSYADLGDKIAMRFGLEYNNIGAKVDGFDNPLIIHAVHTPLTLHYRFNEKIQIFGGGSLGLNFFGKWPTNDGDFQDDDSDLTDFITNLDGSALLGVGYTLGYNIDINLSYNLGLTNIFKSPIVGGEWKKNWLTLSAAYTFRN